MVHTYDKSGDQRFEPIREIRVRGAREHNLKAVDVDIPRDRLVVITGLSGSGKSSLAFDTIFAEGQRKYMESLSAYARQFLDQQKKPDVESIEGLPPTIAIEQRSSGHNPRSTVATSTEIYDYLRLLFARTGGPVCWAPMKKKRDGRVVDRCETPITASHSSQITDAISALEEGTRLLVLAPVIRQKKGFHREVLEDLAKDGYVRARVNGDIVEIAEVLQDEGENPLSLGRYEKHDIDAVVDRITVREKSRARLADSIETALRTGDGVVVIGVLDAKRNVTDTVYSERYACADHPDHSLDELEPRLFSFNSPQGACSACHGLGVLLEYDPELVIPDPEKAIGKGGIAPWKKAGPAGMFSGRLVRRFCRRFDVKASTPMNKLSTELMQILLYGTSEAQEEKYGAEWGGVIPHLQGWFERTESKWVKEFLQDFQAEQECPTCLGHRLSIRTLSVYLESDTPLPEAVVEDRRRLGLSTDAHRFNISDFTRLDIETATQVLEGLRLSPEKTKIAKAIVREVGARLGFLRSVGLGYLSLSRRTSTLSGGEAQRIRLATQVGSGIVGTAYVLDEPTIGLHPRDNARLIRTLRHLADIGNTVLVVEHDEEMIRAADHVVDIGPGPGVHGGQVIAQGTIDEIAEVDGSLTGKYLTGQLEVETPKKRRKLDAKKRALVVKGAKQHNLKEVDVTFPLDGLLAVTGVSGSGKSTLVNDILLRAVKRDLHGSKAKPGTHKRVNGLGKIDRIIEVDQSPIGRTSRSNPATYTGMFTEIRNIMAQTNEAKARGYQPGRFSFNVKGGRCEACQGQGTKKIEMHFLPDIHVECEVCEGSRFNRETMEIRYRGKNIAEVLQMTCEEACAFYENHPKIHRFAKCLVDVGLGYLTLGQPSTTLSGGEAQRVKLAAELGKGETLRGKQDHTLYILDEPTTGLHFEDVRKLVGVLQRLVDQDNTVLVIEHNLDVIKSADWLVDMGPEGGDQGGEVVAEGPPEKVAKSKRSHTAAFLRPLI